MNKNAGLLLVLIGALSTGIIVMRKPRGFRNNNPFNIKQSSNDWVGKVDAPTDKTFEQFSEMKFGVRAGYKLLNNYRKRYGLNTVYKILNRFAPKSENETLKYAEFVADKLGKGIHDELNDTDMFSLGKFIIRFENGEYLDNETLLDGFKLALA